MPPLVDGDGQPDVGVGGDHRLAVGASGVEIDRVVLLGRSERRALGLVAADRVLLVAQR